MTFSQCNGSITFANQGITLGAGIVPELQICPLASLSSLGQYHTVMTIALRAVLAAWWLLNVMWAFFVFKQTNNDRTSWGPLGTQCHSVTSTV